jgi:lysozyme family protein
MNFDMAFDRLLGNEGGYVNNPSDPGGETRWGIAKRSYPTVDIANLSKDAAKAIYLRDFWNPLTGVPDVLKFQVFDFAVNSGMQTAVRKLQAAIGVADDGHWGPQSQAALLKLGPSNAIMLFLSQRLRFMTSLSTWQTFGKGWANRIAADLEYAAKDFA